MAWGERYHTTLAYAFYRVSMSALSLQEIRHLNSVSLHFTRHALEGRGRNRAFKRVGNLTFGSGGG